MSTCARCNSPLSEAASECPVCGARVQRAARVPEGQRQTAPGPLKPVPSKPGGAVLDGRWKLEKVIGEGGMGKVWLGKDLQLDRPVAVKVLSEERSQEAEFVDRFVREAQLLSRLQHPNIVTLYGVGRTGNRPFLVMRFLEGVPLQSMMRKPLSVEQTLPLMKQLLAGLGAMHQAGILHRDIKPPNLLVSANGRLTILDLGIARPGDSSLTKTGVVYGTVGYMSPEQMIGEKTMDARSDLYSAGVVAFQLLSGKMPFSETQDYVALFKSMRNVRPDLLAAAPGTPKAVGDVISQALAWERDERFKDAAEMWQALDKASKPPARKPAPQPAPSAETERVEVTDELRRQLAPSTERVPDAAARKAAAAKRELERQSQPQKKPSAPAAAQSAAPSPKRRSKVPAVIAAFGVVIAAAAAGAYWWLTQH